jgi:cytosine/adenosine deaminase-related metal-dependent hydrolase
VQEESIVAVGRFRDLTGEFSKAAVIDHPESVLLPGLVNAHIHLELSHVAQLSQQQPPDTFPGWIEHMLAARDRAGDQEKKSAALMVLRQQHEDGVAVLADIGNTTLGRGLAAYFPGILMPFRELLGLRQAGVAAQLELLEREDDRECCSAHAPYSAHAALLRGVKERARRFGRVFPVHVAESAEEIKMVSRGEGEFVEFLKRRGFWDGSFQPLGIDNSGSVQYLNQLGLLDEKTLCVHAVHVSDKEITLLAETGSRICLCPGVQKDVNVSLPKYIASV